MRQEKRPDRLTSRIETFVGNAAWDDFVGWCVRKNLNAVPANPWTLAAYLRSLEGTENLAKLRKRVADIGKAHAEKSKRRPERDPLIAKTFHIMEQRRERQAAAAELFDEGDLTGIQPKPSRGQGRQPPSEPTPSPAPKKIRLMRSKPKLVSKRRPSKMPPKR